VELIRLARDEGITLGIGNGWRSEQEQERGFRSRHRRVTAPGDGTVWFDGSWWDRLPGVAMMAPPGRSYHEIGLACDLTVIRPDGTAGGVTAAVSAVLARLAPLCGLVRPIRSEPWHTQPSEVPTARSSYIPSRHTLTTWVVPRRDLAVVPFDPAAQQWGLWPLNPAKPEICTDKPAQTGDHVRYAQGVLAVLAFVARDRYRPLPFGINGDSRGMHEVVRAFQVAERLHPDGCIGPRTWAPVRFAVVTISRVDVSRMR
jgi:hypothetical protein